MITNFALENLGHNWTFLLIGWEIPSTTKINFRLLFLCLKAFFDHVLMFNKVPKFSLKLSKQSELFIEFHLSTKPAGNISLASRSITNMVWASIFSLEHNDTVANGLMGAVSEAVAKRCLLKKRLLHRCFPVNFAKFIRTPFL